LHAAAMNVHSCFAPRERKLIGRASRKLALRMERPVHRTDGRVRGLAVCEGTLQRKSIRIAARVGMRRRAKLTRT